MMGGRQVAQGALFYKFSMEEHVPANHLLRSIERFVEFGDVRTRLAPFYSSTGRPSVDPELMMEDGTFSRGDFTYYHKGDVYFCPGGKMLTCKGTIVNDNQLMYRASKYDCDACALKPRCCPKEPARKVPRSIHEGARDMARDIAKTDAYRTSRRERKKVEMLFAHLKRILRLDRLRLRGPCGAHDEFLLAATAQNLRKLAKGRVPPSGVGAVGK